MDDFAPFLRFLAWSSSCCWTLIVRWMDGWCVAVAPATPPALSPTRRPYRKCSVVAIYVVWYLVESPWPGTEGQIELMICGAKCETDSALPLKGNWNPSLHKIVDVFTHTPTHRQEAHSVRVPSWFPFFFFFFFTVIRFTHLQRTCELWPKGTATWNFGAVPLELHWLLPLYVIVLKKAIIYCSSIIAHLNVISTIILLNFWHPSTKSCDFSFIFRHWVVA